MMPSASVRPRTPQTPTTGHTAYSETFAVSAPTFNRDVMCVGNAENCIARVLHELRKPQPDNARALKLALSALTAVQLIGEVRQ